MDGRWWLVTGLGGGGGGGRVVGDESRMVSGQW